MKNEYTGQEVFDAIIIALDALHSYKYLHEKYSESVEDIVKSIEIINAVRFHWPTTIGKNETFEFQYLEGEWQ